MNNTTDNNAHGVPLHRFVQPLREFLAKHGADETEWDAIDRLEQLTNALLTKRSADGGEGRHWHASIHLHAEDEVNAIISRWLNDQAVPAENEDSTH
jgi:hypothetical protein